MLPNLKLIVLGAGAACILAGCAAAPTSDGRARMVDFPLASTHADFGFTLVSGARRGSPCGAERSCAVAADADADQRFNAQVLRVSKALQAGARNLYPDLAQHIPGRARERFDVYVVAGDKPGSDSSADGRIALNAGLAAGKPYDDWLAFVIAREMGHVIGRHHEENSSASIATSILMNLFLPGSGLLKTLVAAGGSRVAARNAHDVQTLEADRIAFGLLKASGFRLRDVSLSLRVAPAFIADDPWAEDFRKSSANLVAELRTVNTRAKRSLAGQRTASVHGPTPVRRAAPAQPTASL